MKGAMKRFGLVLFVVAMAACEKDQPVVEQRGDRLFVPVRFEEYRFDGSWGVTYMYHRSTGTCLLFVDVPGDGGGTAVAVSEAVCTQAAKPVEKK